MIDRGHDGHHLIVVKELVAPYNGAGSIAFTRWPFGLLNCAQQRQHVFGDQRMVIINPPDAARIGFGVGFHWAHTPWSFEPSELASKLALLELCVKVETSNRRSMQGVTACITPCTMRLWYWDYISGLTLQ